MSYSLTDFSTTEIEFNDGLRNYYYKKCYCSVELQGDYIIFTAHRVENNAFRQQWSVLYSDFTSPSGDAGAVLAAIEVIINSYAGGAAGVDTVTATAPITSSGGSNPNISTFVNKDKLIGRNPNAPGVMEEISIGSGLTLVGTTLSNTATPTPLGYYGAWQDNVTQTAVASNVGYAMIFRTIDVTPNGISVVTNGTNLTRITFANTGIYNLQFSSQFQNVDNAEHDVTIWLRLNGTDVAGSSGFVQVPKRKAAGAGNEGHVVVSWNYVLSVVAGQYYELMWSTTNHTNVTMEFYAGGSPPPSAASVILTVTQQSGIMAGTGITAINSLTGAAQTLAAGTSGTDFAISSAGTAHTFNLPTASATNRGALSTSDWSTFNNKLTGFGQFRKASRWYNNGFFPPANGSFGNINGQIRFVPVLLDQDITITRMAVFVTAASTAGTLCRLGIYSNNSANNQPLTLLVDAGTVALDGATGARPTGVISLALTKGLYWFAYFSNTATGTITGISSGATFDIKGQAAPGATGFAAFNQGLTFGALPATVGTITEVNSGSTVCIYYLF